MNYKKIYDQIIQRAMNRALTGYKERHHIIPRCIGGTNNIDNLVYLTAREHFIVHKLLCEIYPDNNKLFFAYRMMAIMTDSKDNDRLYKIGSREFERIRALSSKLQSDINKGVSKSSETIEKIRKSCIISFSNRPPMSDETKEKISNSLKGRKLSDEHISKLKVSHSGQVPWNKGKLHSIESIEKMKQTKKDWWNKRKGGIVD